MANEPNTTESSATEGTTGPSSSEVAALRPVDELLQIEDPDFAASMAELRTQVQNDAPEASQVEIESLDLEEKPLTKWAALRSKAWLRLTSLIHAVKDFRFTALAAAKIVFKALKSAVIAILGWTKNFIKSTIAGFKSLPLTSKLLVFATFALGIVSIFVVRMVLHGHYLPTLEMNYLRSFADVADQKFSYDAHEPMEDFTDPIFHPEHVMLIDKIVVNLKRPSEDSNPMGLFEFYVEVSTDEAAVEIKDREVEVRDLISRTVEQMDYESLKTTDGKNKLKIVLRKNLNEFATKGRVRNVLFRNIVLKE